MSDNIPIGIQEEIMKRLPVRSLIQFRSVSKSWKSLIESSHFIADYSGRQLQLQEQQHLFVRYQNRVWEKDERHYGSIVDDDSFPHHRVSFTVPRCLKMLSGSKSVGSSHGLMCLHSRDFGDVCTDVAVVWNISIGKAVAVAVPNVGDASSSSSRMYATALGFGVCPDTFDPKIVKINYVNLYRWTGDIESITSIPHQVEVFTLRTGAWRSPYGSSSSSSSNLPCKFIQFSDHRIVIDGVFYWVATDTIQTDAGTESFNLIVSFDLTSEEFEEIYLPPRLADYEGEDSLSVSKLWDSLVVLQRNEVGDATIVWRMDDDNDDDDDDGVPERSFTKLFTIYTPHASILAVHAFRKSGESVIVIVDDDCESFDDDISLVLYEPYSKHITNLGIKGTEHVPSFMCHYMETLLLLDQPNDIVYDKGEKKRLEAYMQRT